MNKRKVGTVYEEKATEYLIDQGYEILERNYRNHVGEIDIISEKDNTIVYIEIKYRGSNQCGDPLEAVDYRKQKQISRVAREHYAKYGMPEDKACRFDVIGIYPDGSIKQIENAFWYQE